MFAVAKRQRLAFINNNNNDHVFYNIKLLASIVISSVVAAFSVEFAYMTSEW